MLYTGISCPLKNNRYTLVDFPAQSSLSYNTKGYKVEGVNYIKIDSSHPWFRPWWSRTDQDHLISRYCGADQACQSFNSIQLTPRVG